MPTPYSRYYTYIKPIIENQAVKSYSPYIFSLVTIAILVVFAIRPTISTILNLQKELQNQQSALQSLKNKSNNLTEAKRNLEALPLEVRSKIDNAVPVQANVTFLIKSLRNLAPQEGSASALQIQPVTIFNMMEPKGKFDVGQISFTYNSEVDYPKALELLTKINKLARVASIDSVSLNKQQGGQLVVSITGRAYFMKFHQ